MNLRMSFYSGALIAGAFGNLIAAGILEGLAGVRGLSAWRWLYILEGSITVVGGIVVCIFLPDFPQTWRALTPEMQHVANRRLALEAAEADTDEEGVSSQLKGLKLCIADPKVWIFAFIYMCLTGAQGFGYYFPTLTRTLGYSHYISLLLVAPPHIFITIWSYVHGIVSDRFTTRYWFCLYPAVISIIGFVVFMTTEIFGPKYMTFFFMMFLINIDGTLFSWIAGVVSRPPAKRAATYALINSLAGQPEPSEAVIENVNEESATHDHEDATTIQTASPAHTQDRTTQPKDDSNSQRASSFRVQRFADRQTLSGWFPQIDNDEKNNWRIWLSRRSRALMVQIGIIGLILMTNFGFTIFAVASYGSSNGVGLIYQGDCSNVKKLDQWLHLLINLLGTGMLSASNYCMQLQAAPTRANVDAAHAAKKWLDIGIPSLRNLRYLSNWRRASWALLALSSIPVHLIYNSAVFQSLSSHNYTVAVIKDSFLANSTWSLTTAEANRAGDWGWNDTRVNPTNLDYEQIIRGMQQNATSYQEMNVSDCFALYDDYWQPQGNVLVLVKNQSVQTPPDDSLLMYVSIVPRSDDWGKNMWALGNGTGRFIAQSPPKPVTVWLLGPKHYEVARCLVQPPTELHTKCRFEYSPPIMFTICIMNFIKAFIMICIWYLRKWQDQKQHRKAKEVLYTLGDAIASFMRDPCEQTKDLGLSTKSDFLTTRKWKDRLIKQTPVILKENTNREAKEFSPTAKQWRSAASLKRWVILLCM
ncbi:putative transporter [Colletotrichum viniferum]|nr:putative transporter [Colletotrichum viniferum]